jgi:hypothetical protein
MIDHLFPLYMVCRYDLNPHLQRPVARGVIRDHPRASINDGFFPQPMRWSDPGPHSRRLAAHSAIYDYMASLRARSIDKDISDDSSVDEDDAPPLIQHHLIDSDSDSESSSAYRYLARRYGWYEDSSGSSDDSSVPSLEYDTEDSIEVATRYLIPVFGGTPLHPKSTWFLEDEISYHDTSSVSSSATNYTSSSSSDCSSHSTRGNNGLPFDSIHLWHISVFNEQLICHMLKSATTWRPTIPPTLPDDDNYPSTNTVDHKR